MESYNTRQALHGVLQHQAGTIWSLTTLGMHNTESYNTRQALLESYNTRQALHGVVQHR